VKKTLAMISKGDTGTYAVKGTRDTGTNGILIDSITPAKPLPRTGASAAVVASPARASPAVVRPWAA
jgi:hypothetical protein